MVGRNKFFVAALGAVAAVTLMSADANAANTYYGLSTSSTTNPALSSWIGALPVPGVYSDNRVVAPVSILSTGNNTATQHVLPLALDPALTMKLIGGSGSQAITYAGTMTTPLAGSASTQFQSNTAGKGITLGSFSSSVTAFGFFLEATPATYTGNITIKLTDAANPAGVLIVLPATGGCAVTVPAVPCSEGATALSSTVSTFIGFTGISSATTIQITAGAASPFLEIADFVEASVPEPASLALLGAGLLGLGIARRRKSA